MAVNDTNIAAAQIFLGPRLKDLLCSARTVPGLEAPDGMKPPASAASSGYFRLKYLYNTDALDSNRGNSNLACPTVVQARQSEHDEASNNN